MSLMHLIRTNTQHNVAFQAVPFTNDELLEDEYQWLDNAMQSLW